MMKLHEIGSAVRRASEARLIGLYDYSNYPGAAAPHVVRDEKTRQVLFRSWDQKEAAAFYEKARDERFAQAVLEIVRSIDDASIGGAA